MPLRSDTDAFQDDAFQNPPDGPAFEREIVYTDAFQDSGFDSGLAFQYATVAGPPTQTVAPDPILTAEAFGVPGLTRIERTQSVTTGEAWGASSVRFVVSPQSIGSLESWGNPTGARVVRAGSIASGETFGTPLPAQVLRPQPIASAEALGSPAVAWIIRPDPIASGEEWGIPGAGAGTSTTQPGAQAGQRSLPARHWRRPERVGEKPAPLVRRLTVRPQPIGSAEAWGIPFVLVGPPAVDEDEELLLLAAAAF